ncbi:hypothetical protein BP6252_09241 [Coleophoma cylindrospora]|uniref:Major facilitator superfamily (MFS) profile domain-containing protein n=1 Tax=Coleophoma cylindrospora TaxID=1849047 RepID=A0A3D8R1D9_9HELO|nr:hypothetical protein BP6252_09241 [Coleophoma cylindrospora]
MASAGAGSSIELGNISTDASEHHRTQVSAPTYARGTLSDSSGATEDIVQSQSLEPTDGGRSAWRLLFCTFMFEALLWGFPLSFGVFQDYYAKLDALKDSPYLTIIGTTATGIPFLSGPLMTPLVRRHAKYQRHMVYLGWTMCILGLVAGSFADTLPTLIVTQGIMYGVGFALFYSPIISMVNEWWVLRRGLAFGIITSASGFSLVAMPFIVDKLLNKYGYKLTLRAMAVSLAILTGPLLPLFKGRLPVSESSVSQKTDWSFVKKPIFWFYCAANVTQGLGFFFPSLYLPSYATSIGLSSTQGALLLALLGLSQVFGQLAFGYLSDGRLPVNVLAMASGLIAAAAAFILWGLARSLGPLIAFTLIYGFFGYGFAALRARLGLAVSGEPAAALAVFSIFCAGQGVGNVMAGPVSAGLLSNVIRVGSYGASKYRTMVIFTGASLVVSALCVGSLYLRPKRLRTW